MEKKKINIKLFYDFLPWVSIAQHRSWWHLCFWPNVDPITCQWNDYFCHHIIAPICLIHKFSFFYIQENLIWHGYNSHAHVVFKRLTIIIVFQEAIFTVKSQVFSGLPTKMSSLSQLSCNCASHYLYHSCEIYLLAFIMILIRYTICLYHIYVCYLSQIRLHSLRTGSQTSSLSINL